MIGWTALGLSVVVTVMAQLMFKYGANVSSLVLKLVAAACFLAAVPLSYVAARHLGIGQYYIGSAASFVIVPIIATKALGESLSRSQIYGILLVVAGIFLYSW